MARDALVPLRLLAVLSGCIQGVLASPTPPEYDALQRVLQPARHPEAQPHQQRKLNGRFLHITDLHPDDFYKAHTSSEEGIACHRGKGMAGMYGAEMTDCDSPFSLVNATFDWIEANIRDDIDFVVWTGDSARHDSDEKHPRTAEQVLDSNRRVADKFVEAFTLPHDGRLAIPVIPTFGNNDFLPHNIMEAGPNKWFHAYSDIWSRFVPEEQRHSFGFGGWFYVEVIPGKLAVFSLNTMFFFDRNAAVDGCANPSEPGFKHMEWLRIQLQHLRDMGMKAILIGHVPPARTDSKQNWDETCWQRYTLWLRQYRDVVTASLFGHMNIDHFLLSDTKKIDLTIETESAADREHMDEGFSVESKSDYLLELRDEWSGLPGSAIEVQEDNGDDGDDASADKKGKKKKKKFKKIGGKYAERYQLSFVSPSVVPNFFPTLRVYEYNITGLGEAALWQDSFVENTQRTSPQPWNEKDWDEETHNELRRSIEAERKKHKKKEGKKGKKKPKKDPNLIVPEDPPKGSLPGPAYYPQALTLTGYTQYFANLTYINNDIQDADVDGLKWRGGNPDGRTPKHSPPKPNKFKYEVEYSTFDDKIYKLKDLTVKSYLGLAYRMGQKKTNSAGVLADDLKEADTEVGADGKGKKKKKKKDRERNKAWLHFLGHAFVKTVPKDELEKM
ncbi:Endopolyphosphatase [Purpureocillium takamizusanense]|uniref:Endopolyphosphatase n=1 Tax=Purpureocillium takamizusanense TaxID=2060973 RepID=A0A9Q8Q946_9HYPO|nr:Endopolyphosphatase [Purpureocillium takamizusanense]UNI14997.1 Endopolyphosphatase [Purpureocillium takamizusanense]